MRTKLAPVADGAPGEGRVRVRFARPPMDEEMVQPMGEGSAVSVRERLDDEVESLRAEATRRIADLQAKLEQRIETQVSALEASVQRAREREARVSELQGGIEESGRALVERVERMRTETMRELDERGDSASRSDAAIAEAAERVRAEILEAASLERAEAIGPDEERAQMAELTLAVRADSARDRIDDIADRRIADAEERIFEAEKRLLEAVAASEREAHRRLLEAADAAFERIEAADRAQERETRVRERTLEAEREAEKRVREAEQRLLELMERADAAESRLARLERSGESG
jgi:hypothetical protein